MLQAMGFALIMGYLFFIGLFAVRKLDDFNKKGGVREEPKASEREQILIYGNKTVERNVKKLLKETGWEVIGIQAVTFGQSWKNVKYILAVSESDEENVTVCIIGKKLYELSKTFGICNDLENRKFFEKAGIQILDQQEQAADEIRALAFGKGA